MLELHGVSKRFGETLAVDSVSFSCGRGELVGIIGRSGAGKSTLLRMINRLTDPSEGRISWQGEDVSRLKGAALRRWRRRCAMIFQQFNLCPRLDVITNVLVGVVAERPLPAALVKFFPAADRARAILALDDLDMAHAALQRAGTLSGGQQQRVAIARALATRPRIIFADEPTGNLDSETSRQVMDLFSQLNREEGITLVLVTHEADIAAYARRRIRFQDGRVIEDTAVTEAAA